MYVLFIVICIPREKHKNQISGTITGVVQLKANIFFKKLIVNIIATSGRNAKNVITS
jgi:hypothetical protein